MKRDRLFVFIVALVFVGWANVVPNTFPQADYGRGFPMKWTYDPFYTASNTDDTPPYLRKYTPTKDWNFDQTALLIDILIALASIGVAMGVNELVQISAGNRSPAITPNV